MEDTSQTTSAENANTETVQNTENAKTETVQNTENPENPEPQVPQRRKRKRDYITQEMKQEKRRLDRKKKKQRIAEKKQRGEPVGPNRKHLKFNTMKESPCKIKVALDLSLEEYMSDKDINSLTSQIQFSYSANRRARRPMQFYACGMSGRTLQRMDTIGDYKGWDIYFRESNYDALFPKQSIVYLTSESPNVLTRLTEDEIYVIGGLVDHNAHKGLCHRLAEEKGIAHARLPISEYLEVKGRKVLAINHVFSILLQFTETRDWKRAFKLEMPTRKGFSPVFGDDDDDKKAGDAKKAENGSAAEKPKESADGTKTEADGTKTEADGTKTEADGTKTEADGTKTDAGDSVASEGVMDVSAD